MKTAISVPDTTFARVQRHADRLDMSRSEFFAKAAERWADQLDDDETVDAINAALNQADEDSDFVRHAARRTLADSE